MMLLFFIFCGILKKKNKNTRLERLYYGNEILKM